MEIKFRGKRVDNSEWVYGYIWIIPGVDLHYILTGKINIRDCSIEKYEVDPVTVGMWTGLYEKNGAEIYEGDILKNDLVGDLWEVFRNLSRFEVGLIPNSGFIGHAQKYPQFAHSEDLMDVFDEFYKVGNKWDNPELLEASHRAVIDNDLKREKKAREAIELKAKGE